MGIKRRYQNFVEKFLSQSVGKRFFQFFYSWGAAIVIIGALAKLMHWPYNLGNILLYVGLITEFFVFVISAFDRPLKDYKWEDVFPVLDSKDPEDRPLFGGGGGDASGGSVIIGGGGFAGGSGFAGGTGGGSFEGEIKLPEEVLKKSFGIPLNVDITEEDTNALTASIKKMSEAAEQLSKMSELSEATQQYFNQLSSVSENIQRLGNVTDDLAGVLDNLMYSYKNIADNSDGVSENSRGYVEQMEALNHNISNLNRVYEMQFQSVNVQMEAVNRINAGLMRIREMYEGSVMDSSIFRSETERMTQHIGALNNVYARLLSAMTMNVQPGFGGGQPPMSYGNPGYNPSGGYYHPGYTPPPAGGYNPPPENNNKENKS